MFFSFIYSKIIRASNAIDGATSTGKNWGFIPVSGKGGKTTNFEIPEWMFDRELQDMMEGCGNA